MTATAALPILLRLERKRSMLRSVLGCRGAPHLHPVPRDVAADTPDLDWSHCPLDLVADPAIAAVLHLARLAEIAPLSGWPMGYAAWAVAGVLTVRGQT